MLLAEPLMTTPVPSVENARIVGPVKFTGRQPAARGERVLWEGTYQGKRCFFISTIICGTSAEPVKSPYVWWRSKKSAMSAEVADTRTLNTMNASRMAY